MIFSGYNSTVPISPAPILIIFSVLFIAQFVVKRDKRHQKFEQFERQYGPVAEAAPKETVCGKMD